MRKLQSVLESGRWIVNGQWVVDEKIASGGFGAVYKGHNVYNNEIVAVKTEKPKNKQNYVEREVQIYKALGSIQGFPRMHWTGRTSYPSEGQSKSCMAMVIDFLGPSLSDLFYKQQRVFSLKTVLLLADQMLHRLESLHDKGVVHRDIKPGNFVMGYGSTEKCVYLIDFGLSHKYRLSSGAHIKYDENVPFRGTHRYASINAHDKVEQTRRDDLESLAYVLIYFLKGGLPWQNLNVEKERRRQVIGEMKKNATVGEITATLPDEFATFLTIVRKLQFSEKPNYAFLRQLFKKCFKDQKFIDDGHYDWSQIPSVRLPIAFPSQTISNHKTRKRSTHNSIEIIDTKDSQENKTPTSRKRKLMEPPQPSESKQNTKPKSPNLRPLKNRPSLTTTMTTLDYELSPEVIEISDDCSF